MPSPKSPSKAPPAAPSALAPESDDAARAKETRRAILQCACELATHEGLEGLSIGRLAKAVGMSKSGLFAHFGSKEDLQIATVDTAVQIFTKVVIGKIVQEPAGLERYLKLMAAWLEFVEAREPHGGCFFAAAAAEFDGRPGPVRDRIAAIGREWTAWQEMELCAAQKAGELRDDVPADQLAFECYAFVQQANWARQLLDSDRAYAQARRAVWDRLARAATAKGKRVLGVVAASAQ